MSNGKILPITYTCDGDGVSPPLNWHGAPEGSPYYAPDGVHWYWTMFNIGGENKYIKSGEVLGQIGTNSVNNLNEYAHLTLKDLAKRFIHTPFMLYLDG